VPNAFGPYTACYNRFVRWRRAGVWNRIMNALAGAHDAAAQTIDTSIVRAHQHGVPASLGTEDTTTTPAYRLAHAASAPP
jgi:transposase